MPLRGRTFRLPRVAAAGAAGAAVRMAAGLASLAALAALAASACTLTTSLDDYAGPPRGAGAETDADASGPADARAETSAPVEAGVDASDRATVYRDAILLDAPLSYYRFRDTGSVARDEVGTADGTFVNGSTRVTGLFAGDQAASFAGNAYVDLGDHFGFVGHTTFTVETWVSPQVANGSPMCLVAKNTDGDGGVVGDGWALYLGGSNETIGSRWRNGEQKASTGPKAPKGTWSHVVTTFDGVRLRVYLDAQLVADEPANGDLVATPSATTLGASRDGRTCFLRGALDEVALYDHVLGEARIGAHFEAGKPAH